MRKGLKFKKKSNKMKEVSFKKCFFELFICQNNVHKREDIEVKEQSCQSQNVINELVFSEQEFDGNDQTHVADELGQPRPEGCVDVGQVLVLSSFHHVCGKNGFQMQILNI